LCRKKLGFREFRPKRLAENLLAMIIQHPSISQVSIRTSTLFNSVGNSYTDFFVVFASIVLNGLPKKSLIKFPVVGFFPETIIGYLKQ